MCQPGQLESLKSKGRSRVTNARVSGRVNARSLFAGEIDGRSIWARRYRDLVCGYVDDAGGVESLSELRISLIRRVAALTVEAERLEVDLARGREVDVDLLARLSSHIRRIAETVGLDRVIKDVTPSLADIVREHAKTTEQKPPPKTSRRAAKTLDLSATVDVPDAAPDASSTAPEPVRGAAQ